MTLLNIVNESAVELGLPEQNFIINNKNKIARQMLRLANASGLRLMKRYDWQSLTKEYIHQTIDNENQGSIQGGIVKDGDWHRFIPHSHYNRSTRRRVRGPYTSQEWQRDKGTVSSTVQEYFRLRGGELLMIPAPGKDQIIAGEYISLNWVSGSDGITKKSFERDDDISLIEEDLIILDVKWRWRKAHGFDYAEEKQEFEIEVINRRGEDKGSRIIQLDHPDLDQVRVSTPEGGFGQ